MSSPMVLCPGCGHQTLRQGERYSAHGVITVWVCTDPLTGDGCGHEIPPLYGRSRAERNADQRNATAACRGCGTTVTASKPTLLRAYCHDCYRLQRERPLSAAAVQGHVRRMP